MNRKSQSAARTFLLLTAPLLIIAAMVPVTRQLARWRATVALAAAVNQGDEEAVRRAIGRGADVDASMLQQDYEANGATRPIMTAASDGNPAIVTLLRKAGARASLDEKLLIASSMGEPQEVQRLLAQGADIEARDLQGDTPLSSAAAQGHLPVMRVLLRHGADIEARDLQGDTPLNGAAGRGNLLVVRVLLRHGANADARNQEGWTASDWASGPDLEAIQNVLKQHMKRPPLFPPEPPESIAAGKAIARRVLPAPQTSLSEPQARFPSLRQLRRPFRGRVVGGHGGSVNRSGKANHHRPIMLRPARGIPVRYPAHTARRNG